jgi:hypothetical protein
MAAILDRWVPSRRLERKRQQALQERLDTRFGDTHITAPTEGAWNQLGSDVNKDYLPVSVANHALSPDLPPENLLPESRMSTEKAVEDGAPLKDAHRHNFTITIPLPWSSRKSHTRTPSTANSATMSSTRKEDQPELSPGSFMSSPEPTPRSLVSSPDPTSKPYLSSPDPNFKSYISSPATTLDSHATSPVAIYKPVSEEYKQQLAEMTGGITRVESPSSLPPERAQNSSPTNVTYKPASEDFAKELAEIGMGPSPLIPQRETFSRPRATSKPTPIGLPSDPRPALISQSPDLRIPPTGLPPDPRPTHVSHSPDPAPAPMGLPAQPRVGATRSAPRGPAPDRVDTTRSASRGPAADRVGTTRSASRGPASDRVVPTRSASRGPTSDRAGTTRSSSRGPTLERIGTTRSSSRGPAPDRLPTTRSASRGPLSKRSVNASHGRSSSHAPTSTRIPYRESVSSNSSAGSAITDSSSPTFNNSFTHNMSSTGTTNILSSSTAERNRNGSLGSPAGYYAAVANEYKRIASDVEDSEYEKRRIKEMENHGKRTVKKKDKAWQGPQEMVPDADALW